MLSTSITRLHRELSDTPQNLCSWIFPPPHNPTFFLYCLTHLKEGVTTRLWARSTLDTRTKVRRKMMMASVFVGSRGMSYTWCACGGEACGKRKESAEDGRTRSVKAYAKKNKWTLLGRNNRTPAWNRGCWPFMLLTPASVHHLSLLLLPSIAFLLLYPLRTLLLSLPLHSRRPSPPRFASLRHAYSLHLS